MHNRQQNCRHNHYRHFLEDKCPPNSLCKCPPTTAATAKIRQMSSKHNRRLNFKWGGGCVSGCVTELDKCPPTTTAKITNWLADNLLANSHNLAKHC